MPAVNFERMLQAVIANGGAANQMLYWSRPVNWKDQALTPNPNTIYFNPFYDTTSGPVVLEIPPAEGESSITGSIDDAWQCALEDVGPAGVDRGNGGKYLITPPGYKGTPPSGYIVVPSDTYRGFAILRSNFKSGSDADIAAAVAYGRRMKIYPLGSVLNKDSSAGRVVIQGFRIEGGLDEKAALLALRCGVEAIGAVAPAGSARGASGG